MTHEEQVEALAQEMMDHGEGLHEGEDQERYCREAAAEFLIGEAKRTRAQMKPTWAEVRGLSLVMFHTAGVTDERNRIAAHEEKQIALDTADEVRLDGTKKVQQDAEERLAMCGRVR